MRIAPIRCVFRIWVCMQSSPSIVAVTRMASPKNPDIKVVAMIKMSRIVMDILE